MKKVIKHLLTGKDNETFDIARFYLLGGFVLLSVVAVPAALMTTGAAAAMVEPLGLALGALATGTGVLMKAKEKQEPDGN